jgi:hypothetical protein
VALRSATPCRRGPQAQQIEYSKGSKRAEKSWKKQSVLSRSTSQNVAATNWANGTLTRTVYSYAQNGSDWMTLTSAQSGTSNAAGDEFASQSTSTSSTSYGYDANGAETATASGDANVERQWDFIINPLSCSEITEMFFLGGKMRKI